MIELSGISRSVAFERFLQAGLRNNNDVVAWLDTLVSQNNAEAALVLGKITQYKRQYDKAIQLYTKAHELKHPDGMFYFGKMYQNLTSTQTQGIDVTNRYRDSARLGSKHGLNELLILSASNGKASLHLAQMYELGEVVYKNLLKAIEFYEKASQQNCSEATYYLAELYARGTQEVAVDISKACGYYLLASQQGHASAIASWRAWAQRGPAEVQYRLGYDYYRTLSLGYRNYSTHYDIPNAVTWCVKAEIQGHSLAVVYLSGTFLAEVMWTIAREYDSSTFNIEKSKKKALEYAVKASSLGFKEASAYVAHIYQQGNQGVRANHQKSFEYYALAAKQGQDSARQTLEQIAESGDIEAQYHLGYGYYREKNEIERAIYWCVKAEAQEHIQAKTYLENTFSKEICWKISTCYASEKSNLARNQQKALEYALEASELGVKEASRYLAKLFYEGNAGVQRDIIKSFNYFVMATKQGDSSALNILESYATSGDKEAQFALAEYYRELKHDEMSLRWFVRAEIAGHTQAKQMLKNSYTGDHHWLIANVYLELGLTQEDLRWRHHCQKAADKGNAHAAFYLAQQSEGLDVSRHRSSILTRYNTAAQSGNGESEAATHRFASALIYSIRNSGTLFASSNDGSIQSLHSIQQKMKRKNLE